MTTTHAAVQITRMHELASGQGTVVHHAHVGVPQHPAHAPGHLELGPLWLAVDGQLRPGGDTELHDHDGVAILTLVRGAGGHYEDDQGNDLRLDGPTAVVASARSGMKHRHANPTDAPVEMVEILLASPADGPAQVSVAPHDGPLTRVAGPEDLDVDATAWWGTVHRHHTQVAEGRALYIAALTGPVSVGGERLEAGDRAVVGPGPVVVDAAGAEVVLLDLPAPVRG